MTAPNGNYRLALPALLLALTAPPLALAKTAPPNIIAGNKVVWVSAAHYRAKTFKLPTGSIRIVEFKKSGSGTPYSLTSENELYILSGTAEVTVNGKTETLSAGDAVNLPTGTLLAQSNAAQDTTVILYTAPNTSTAPVGSVVHSRDAKQAAPPPGPPRDGMPGAAITIKTYPFDGNSIRVIRLSKPGVTPVTAHDMDSILYLVSGKMRLTLGDETNIISAGDAVREPAGVPSFWEVLEDSIFVSTSGPSASNAAK